MPQIWRVGAGDKEKDYMPLMLEEGVMMIGPGAIGDLTGLSAPQIEVELVAQGAKATDSGVLLCFRDRARENELVILRLGSVCFAVGAIAGPYEWRSQFDDVRSYWNAGYRNEQSWDLQHVRKVDWFALKEREALCWFRRGIYGGQQRFCGVQDRELHSYMQRLGYDGNNAGAVLEKIGVRTNGVNQYGFPAA